MSGLLRKQGQFQHGLQTHRIRENPTENITFDKKDGLDIKKRQMTKLKSKKRAEQWPMSEDAKIRNGNGNSDDIEALFYHPVRRKGPI